MKSEDINNDVAVRGGNRQMGPMAENSDGSSDNNRPTPPTNSDGSEGQMGTPPNMNCTSDDEDCEMMEPPDGFDEEMPSDRQGIQGGGFGGKVEFLSQASNNNPDAVLHPVAYLSIGALGVVMGILVSYACFSHFFHLNPGQAFATKGKFIGFITVALAIAAVICVFGFFIPKWCS